VSDDAAPTLTESARGIGPSFDLGRTVDGLVFAVGTAVQDEGSVIEDLLTGG
jgi:hypothetical protein